jgi:Protein of unknown function (DUF732)
MRKFLDRAVIPFGAALAIGAAVAGANLLGVAHADGNGYLAELGRHGIPDNGDALLVGLGACQRLIQGAGVTELIDELTVESGRPRILVQEVVLSAHVYLCPDAPFFSTADSTVT